MDGWDSELAGTLNKSRTFFLYRRLNHFCVVQPVALSLLYLFILYLFIYLFIYINPLNPELNPICYLLALLAHHFLHVSRIRVKSLTLRPLMSYIYGAPILDVSRSHTTTQHSR